MTNCGSKVKCKAGTCVWCDAISDSSVASNEYTKLVLESNRHSGVDFVARTVAPEVEMFSKVLKVYEPDGVGDFLIVVESHRYVDVCMNFIAYECVCISDDGKPEYPEYGVVFGGGVNSNYRECQSFMDGGVKWDGCCNVMFSEQIGNNYLHFCGVKDARKVARLFEKLYMIAPECIENWDSEVAGN